LRDKRHRRCSVLGFAQATARGCSQVLDYGSKMEPSNSSLVSSDQWAARSQQLIGNRETPWLGPSCRYG
jgi:hypothetical protein